MNPVLRKRDWVFYFGEIYLKVEDKFLAFFKAI
jgi:hypothetical protein